MELLVATGNRNKVEEFSRILAPLGITVVSPKKAGLTLEVEETGGKFLENARLKARAFYEATGKPAVADDSGLCVDALGGRPGVLSARYHGEDSTYAEKMNALLEELKDVPDERRTGHFACAISCVLGDGTVVECEERCEGTIAPAPSGAGGFGYDPLFLHGGKSFAELSPQEKDAVSHRGKALRMFAEKLLAHMRDGIVVVPAGAEDLDGVMEIVAACKKLMSAEGNNQWNDGYPLREHFAHDIAAQELLVCKRGDAILGMVCVNTDDPEEYADTSWTCAGPAAYIHRMASSPDARRMGIGNRLVEAAERRARELGVPCMKTDTNEANVAMNRLLDGRGYKGAGKVRLHSGPGWFNCYEKLL